MSIRKWWADFNRAYTCKEIDAAFKAMTDAIKADYARDRLEATFHSCPAPWGGRMVGIHVRWPEPDRVWADIDAQADIPGYGSPEALAAIVADIDAAVRAKIDPECGKTPAKAKATLRRFRHPLPRPACEKNVVIQTNEFITVTPEGCAVLVSST